MKINEYFQNIRDKIFDEWNNYNDFNYSKCIEDAASNFEKTLIQVFQETLEKHSIYKDRFIDVYKYCDEESNKPIGLLIRVETGGFGGGSCWDDSNPEYYGTDFNSYDLDDFFVKFSEALFPSESREVCLKLADDVFYTKHASSNEYYGNCTNYYIWYFGFEELEACVVGCNLKMVKMG